MERDASAPCPEVFLGEVNSGISSTQVVVKELKASASVQDQMQFLEEAQPYRWVRGRSVVPILRWAHPQVLGWPPRSCHREGAGCLAELSMQHGSVPGLAGCRELLVPSPGCAEVMGTEGGGHGAGLCPARAEQMPLCGVSWGAGTQWYPLPALPVSPCAPGGPPQCFHPPTPAPAGLVAAPWCRRAPRSAPRRALQHTNLLQCLAQCAEVTPYLLVMEFCPLGDLKGYLRSCRGADTMAPDPLTLQRMACEVACGVLHLHRNNYIHRPLLLLPNNILVLSELHTETPASRRGLLGSDLALRNCLLTADLTVKIGDYGLSHCKYKDDYFVTADQLWVPLRWIAPELIDEVHGNLLIVDQTKASNVWSLGVTIWELFELGSQPYDHYSDRQVLAYAIKEQQLKLPKPQLKLSLAERW
ncbi:Serine/threonine-protein kinase LMTK1 isoform X2 [Aix galericulata]|nr:Serine/threonine-protein kinase LMTK1 isoform X2 [Aix galericulata]